MVKVALSTNDLQFGSSSKGSGKPLLCYKVLPYVPLVFHISLNLRGRPLMMRFLRFTIDWTSVGSVVFGT
jgi:hypothetical protein